MSGLSARRALLWVGLCAGTMGLGAAEQESNEQAAATAVIVRVGQPGAAIPPTLFGIFFEDINFAADGGIYPERVKNRSFEFPDPLMGWHRAAIDAGSGSFGVASDAPLNPKNPHYLRLRAERGAFGVTNDGFRGIGVREKEPYTVSLHARLAGEAPASLRVELENTRNEPLGGVTLSGFSRNWRR